MACLPFAASHQLAVVFALASIRLKCLQGFCPLLNCALTRKSLRKAATTTARSYPLKRCCKTHEFLRCGVNLLLYQLNMRTLPVMKYNTTNIESGFKERCI